MRALIAAVCVAAMAACASPGSLPLGMSQSEALQTLGAPTAKVALPDGGSRLQYSGQPFNQSVWNVDFDAQGRLVRTDQMMSDASFLRIQAGQHTQQDILRDFGRPADVYRFRLADETAFMYRYLTHGGFKAAMFVYFDPAGVVKRTETGLDPWAIRNGNRND
jgi:hypothetical protein